MKYFSKYIFLGLAFAASATFTGCSDDDVITQLPAPDAQISAESIRSLSFNWEPVANATQYGLQLFDESEEIVDTKVTSATSATFTGLQPATTYTLKVWAYGALGGDYSTSPTYILTATTPSIITLDAPVLTVNDSESPISISWAPVDNADYYVYTLVGLSDGVFVAQDIEISDTSVTFGGLDSGDYEFSVYAASRNEAFSKSEVASVTFTQSRTVLYVINGTYYSCYYQRYHDTPMTVYSDGTYSIADFYKVAGYNLDFTVDADGNMTIVNPGVYEQNGWTYVPTGIDGYDIPFWMSGGYAGFEGTRYEGQIWLYNGWSTDDDDAYDMYFWNEIPTGPTVDDIVGSYNVALSGWDLIQSSDWTYFDYTWTVTLTKVDETTVALNDFYWSGFSLNATFDPEAMTLTFPYQPWGVYFFGLDNADDNGYITPGTEAAVVAPVGEDGSITLNNWAAIYGNYTYTADTAATLTPAGADTASHTRSKSVKAPLKMKAPAGRRP